MAKIRPLSTELKKIAFEELNEVEERIAEDITVLKEYLKKQPHLKARLNDQFLVSILRGCKYSLEKAKLKIDHFYTFKALRPDAFLYGKVEQVFNFNRTSSVVWLAHGFTPNGPSVIFNRYSDLSSFPYVEFVRYRNLIPEILLNTSDNAAVVGFVDIHDLSTLSLNFLAKIDMTLVTQTLKYFKNAAPIRLKGIHYINCPSEAQWVLNLVKSFAPPRLKERIYVHKSFEELNKFFPMEYLPKDYGGSNKSLSEMADENKREIMEFEEYFLTEHLYGVDERFREEKLKSAKTLFGAEGSFRKLNID